MKIALTLLFVLIVGFETVTTLPSTFDFRVQPSLVKYADFSFKHEGTCVAHAWGQQLAQIVSNAASLYLRNKVRLSSQHLIECIADEQNDICHDADIQDIKDAIDYIQRQGITTIDCIKNRLFSKPNQFCPRTCDAGYEPEYRVKAVFTPHTDFNSTLKALTADETTTAFVIVKVYNSMNYYTSSNLSPLENVSGENFEYRVGEIVGWKNKGLDLVVRIGSGEGWGFNGFANLNQIKHHKIIEAFYTVKYPTTSRIQKPKVQQIEI